MFSFFRRHPAPIVVAGHSHIVALGVSHSTQPGMALTQLRADPPIYAVTAPWPRPDNYLQTLGSVAKGKRVALLFSGWNQLLFAPEPLFDFVSSAFPGLPLHPEATAVPESLVMQHDDIRHLPATLRHSFSIVRKGGARRLIILCLPPPRYDSETLRARFKIEGFIRTSAAAMGIDLDTVKITPPLIRLKLWGIVRDVYRAQALALGALFVDVPAGAQDGLGFLKEEYWAEDATHANLAYGQLYLDHIVKVAG